MYRHFAPVYDIFMDRVPYAKWADFIGKKLESHNVPPGGLVLDLACGTGTMARLMAQKGYDIIGVDSSEDMLSVAYSKTQNILFLHQDILELDLYGTVNAAYSTCDALNYMLTDDDFTKALANVSLFLENSVFVFDLKTDYKYRQMGGNSFSDTKGDASYLWKNSYDTKTCLNEYRVQFFADGRTFSETHRQRAYSSEAVVNLARRAGLKIVSAQDNYTDTPAHGYSERITYTASKIT